MKLFLKSALTLAAVVSASSALAGHVVVYAPTTDASSYSVAAQGLEFGTATSHFINGSAFGTQSASPGGLTTGAGSTAYTFAKTQQTGFSRGQPSQNDGFASADFTNGFLKTSVLSIGLDIFGAPLGIAQAQLYDTVFFTNTTNTAQLVTFNYQFDGAMTNPYAANGGNPGGFATLDLACTSASCSNDLGERIVFGTGPLRVPSNAWTYFFDYNSPGYFAENGFGGQGGAPYFQYGLNQPGGGGVVDGFISTQLLIPTGQSSIGVRGTLKVDCRSASSCDFGNTGRFGFNPLPQGLSFGSASGVFLTGSATGAVPEPATWAMMLFGFGLIGSTMRRRTATRVSAKV